MTPKEAIQFIVQDYIGPIDFVSKDIKVLKSVCAGNGLDYTVFKHDLHGIVVLVRGTDEEVDWYTNIDIRSSKMKYSGHLLSVHRGFCVRAKEIQHQIALLGLKFSSVTFIGHSMGGAIAEILCAMARERYMAAKSIVFGSPGWLRSRRLNTIDSRFIFCDDLVTQLPLSFQSPAKDILLFDKDKHHDAAIQKKGLQVLGKKWFRFNVIMRAIWKTKWSVKGWKARHSAQRYLRAFEK